MRFLYTRPPRAASIRPCVISSIPVYSTSSLMPALRLQRLKVLVLNTRRTGHSISPGGMVQPAHWRGFRQLDWRSGCVSWLSLGSPLWCYMSLRRIGIVCGILGPLLWLSLIGVAGAMRPEFNHITHYISELGERGSSTEFLMRYGAFGFTGLLYVCFAAALLATFRDGWYSTLAAGLIGLDGLGRIGAGVFACDPGCGGLSSNQELHHLFATLGFSSGTLAAIAWGFTFQRRGWPQPLTWYSVGTGILALIFLLMMSWSGDPLNAPGLFEHLATGVLSLWLLVFAAGLTRHPDQALRRS